MFFYSSQHIVITLQAQCLLNLSGDTAELSSNAVAAVGPSVLSSKSSPQHHALQAMQLLTMPELHSAAKETSTHVNSPPCVEPRTDVIDNQTNSRSSSSSDIKNNLQSKYKITEL